MHPMLVALALLLLPQTKDATLPPPDAQLKTTVVGLGVQVYKCAPVNGGFEWTLEMPQATLFDPSSKQAVGTHSIGPTWTWNDGSAIAAVKVLEKQDSPDASAIPWLLVQTHDAATTSGVLLGVAYVRRSDTQGGKAPATGCDVNSQQNHVRVPYQATYTFYTTN
jgi:hypothetical protein